MKNAVVIAAIETIRNKEGKVVRLSDTFLDDSKTWKGDHRRTFETKILDCRTYKELPSPMTGLWEGLAAAFGDRGIDRLAICCHSDWEGLYIFSKIRKELSEDDRYITLNREWAGITFNPGAKIEIHGCQAGGRDGVRMSDCIAATIANKSGAIVLAYTSKTSQQRRPDGGYYQKADRGKMVEFVPAKRADTPDGGADGL